MPFLDWVNKNQAKDTSREVPYHLLKREAVYGNVAIAANNLLIQGDNLLALKALLPLYAGRVKCIFIDPPYNTQSAFEHYDDRLEHSQWLSMMYPRLVLLQDLLAEDGSIWVTIDDNEAHYLKVLMDEVFGRSSFVANIFWQKNHTRENRTDVSTVHDHVLLYAKNRGAWKSVRNMLPASDNQLERFTNPDNDPRGVWASLPAHAKAEKGRRQEQFFTVTTPSGRKIDPPPGRCWLYTEPRFQEMVADNRIWFGVDGNNAPRVKKFLSEVQAGLVPSTLWLYDEVGSNGHAKAEVVRLFPDQVPFSTPKPEALLRRVLHIATNPSDLILDSFLGSGTTAAVAHKMGRHYIGIEMGEHARTHCVPRLENVIAGEQGGISEAVGWKGGGGFSFLTLSEPAFDKHGRLNPAVKFPTLAAYVWHMETGDPGRQAFDTPFLGLHDGKAYFLLYNGILGDRRPAGGNVLTSSILAHLRELCSAPVPFVVYGETARLGPARLAAESVAFKQIPYDNDALAALVGFIKHCRTAPVAQAWQAAMATQGRQSETYHKIFPDIPCVCLRVPTGGGKTLLAAHAVAQVGKALKDTDTPIALWLTPSDTIRSQTLDALSDVRHPYRQALAHYVGDNLRVADLENLQTVGTGDVGKACIIVVATIQSLNVSDTSKRNVYAFFEDLQEHFRDLPPALATGLEKVTSADLASQPFLTEKDIGRVKWSVANWIHLHRPLVIVDEAHNNRTDRFFKTLGRLNPACIVELTATPVAGNNVLYHVSAQELRAEQMIKLPIVLAEHPEGWCECLRDAILTRDRLETVAQKETDYMRPIALIQAMPKGGEATVDVVKQHLIEQEKIPAEQIAITTGSQKELDGINLFDPGCPVRYVITVEALKEGWDCSFAYVLASLQSVNSAKDVEQLLGRVLRMPYARDRSQAPLNKAYAHIVAENFAEAASNLKDRLVQNMGFERLDTAALIVPQQPLPLAGGFGTSPDMLTTKAAGVPECHIELPEVPETEHWPAELKAQVQIHATSQGATLVLKGNVDSETLKQAEAFSTVKLPAKAKEKVAQQFANHRAMRQAMKAPAQLGLTFAPIPQLCLALDGYLEVVEKNTLAELGDWSLLDAPVQLDNFAIHETVNLFEINIKGAKVSYKHTDAQQLKLNEVASHVSEQDLVRWLDTQVRQPYVSQLDLQAYLVKLLTHLVHPGGFRLTALVRARFQLADAIKSEVERLRLLSMKKGFQRRLFKMTVPTLAEVAQYSFTFDPSKYPARNLYHGSYEFNKHFYPVIHDLREKTGAGATAEEFRCAQAIDAHPNVKHWVRNIERQPQYAFWLPTSSDYFYPDFVAELEDGRALAVEYKGEPYKTNDDSKEKMQVGYQWEQSSEGRCLFLFAVADDAGRDVFKQVNDKLSG
ncbi:hypothetical protein DFQ28_001252 [Apophysomyces sp. BC1034]|nr:hypothetical protein DFQ28_001252 [Apophysomyces sp. BC1034]